jgi:hypothetical protein
MTRRLATIVGLLVLGVAGADAHQLDEYLQASRIDAARDRIVVEISLTPGVAVAPRIIGLVDRDGDGRISSDEIDRYARQVVADLALSVDGTVVPLALTRVENPSWDDVRDGTGTIRLEAQTPCGLAAGAHRLHYVNAHEAASSVYLVNALVPTDRGIAIAAQHRDVLQRSVDIDLFVAHAYATAIWLLVACGALGALTLFRVSHHLALSGAHR